MAADLKHLETHLRHTIRVALAAQEKLSAAREAAGLRNPRSIYTAAEVKELRVEFHEEWVAFFKAQHPDSPFQGITRLLARNTDPKEKERFFASIRAIGEKRSAVNPKKGN